MFKGDMKMNKLYKKYSISLTALIFFVNGIMGQDFFFGNNKPSADAGKDIKALSGETIFLDGSRSFVGDGSKIKYHWIFAPGLVIKSENDFSSAISIETYGSKYLKSVQSHKQVLKVTISDNDPGTKLEVVLKIKDRIGFEDRDTLLVEYSSPKAPADTLVSALPPTIIEPSPNTTDPIENNTSLSGVFIQGFADNKVNKVDVQIINSIIMDQIKSIGFDYTIFLARDIRPNNKPKGYKDECNTDLCIAQNAMVFNARYVLSWNFAQAEDKLSLRVFESIDHGNLIDEDIIIGPYTQMNESGIYGLEPALRSGVSKLMGANNFKKDISTIDRLLMKNESLISYGKYPLILGAAYLFIDKVFTEDDSEPEPEMPPGFPHD